MKKNILKEKIFIGQSVFGLWITIKSPDVCEILSYSGLDFQILDIEHGVFDASNLGNCIRAIELNGGAPLVRVSGLYINEVQKALDLGAYGIIFPQVKNYKEALDAVSLCRFFPEGTRGFNPFVRAGCYGNKPLSVLNNEFPLISIIIENKEAFSNLDHILTIKELDVIYLGVYDMSVALGCMGQVEDPSIIEFIKVASEKIIKAGKCVGVMVQDASLVRKYFDLGIKFIVIDVDSSLMRNSFQGKLSAFKEKI
ncbi:MAG: hypothetical protein KBD63_00910 [Bacteriovoracaceae bacterium]|nr:hypothetical protein [Bacteriovoracaceae bacterium]